MASSIRFLTLEEVLDAVLESDDEGEHDIIIVAPE